MDAQFIIGGTVNLSTFTEDLHFMDSLNLLPMSLESVKKLFDVARKNV